MRIEKKSGPAQLNSEITKQDLEQRLQTLHEESAEKTPLQRFDFWRMVLSLIVFAILVLAIFFKFAR